MYRGAALIQVAEHKKFTAINSLKVSNKLYSNAYRINDKIALYMKYASKKSKPHDEYIFTFLEQHLKELKLIHKVYPKTYISLVCVKDREICCLNFDELFELVIYRKKKIGYLENQITVLVTAHPKKSLRVYVNSPGERNTILGTPLLIKRSEFPSKIFG